MKRWYYYSLACALLIGCGTTKPLQRYDDPLDIRPEQQFQYEVAPCACDETMSNRRDGRTLRGTVVEMLIQTRRDSSGAPRHDTAFVFLARCAADRTECLELIPLQDVILPALQPDMVRNAYGNVNRVRSFNTVTGIPEIRDVPVRVVGCDCEPLEASLRWPSMKLRCPARHCSWYFVELRAIPALFSYTDWLDRQRSEERTAFAAEIAAGFRFGTMPSMMMRRKKGYPDEETASSLSTDYCYRWGIGLAFTVGTRAYNLMSANPPEDYLRPTLVLHLRYTFDRSIACIRPFVYAQVGTAIDRLTMNLWRFSLRLDEGKQRRIAELDSILVECAGQIPGLNLAIPNYSLRMNASAPPLTVGIGVGVEIPIAPQFDLGIDLGYRSLGIGDELIYNGESIPQGRRIDLWRLRIGVTF